MNADILETIVFMNADISETNKIEKWDLRFNP